jgi:hypothetical protein
LKRDELLLKELLLESKERTNACLKLHEASLWVESIAVDGSEMSLTAELFSSRKKKRRNQRRQEQRRGTSKTDSSSTDSSP